MPLIPNVLKVFLENGQTRSFRYDSNTTAEVICVPSCIVNNSNNSVSNLKKTNKKKKQNKKLYSKAVILFPGLSP